MADPAPLIHHSQGRSPRNAGTLVVIWAGLAGLLVFLDAAPWIVGSLAIFTLPLAWEVWRNPQCRLTIDATALEWQGILGADRVPLARIDKVRFDRRLDMSVRVTLVLTDGRKLRLPQDVLPPPERLETALQAHGIRTERHPFSLIG